MENVREGEWHRGVCQMEEVRDSCLVFKKEKRLLNGSFYLMHFTLLPSFLFLVVVGAVTCFSTLF